MNLWQSILNDVAHRDDDQFDSHLIVLGDRGTGKRSLINAVNKQCVKSKNKFIEVEKMGSQYSGIDFEFLYVKDMNERDAMSTMVTSDDNLPRMNVWMLQDAEKADLLKMVMRPEHLEYTAAMIVLDFDQPWEMMESLSKWTRILSEVVQSLMKDLPLEQKDMLKNRIAKHFKNFELNANGEEVAEPEEKNSKKKEKKVMKENEDDSFESDMSDGERFMNNLKE